MKPAFQENSFAARGGCAELGDEPVERGNVSLRHGRRSPRIVIGYSDREDPTLTVFRNFGMTLQVVPCILHFRIVVNMKQIKLRNQAIRNGTAVQHTHKQRSAVFRAQQVAR